MSSIKLFNYFLRVLAKHFLPFQMVIYSDGKKGSNSNYVRQIPNVFVLNDSSIHLHHLEISIVASY